MRSGFETHMMAQAETDRRRIHANIVITWAPSGCLFLRVEDLVGVGEHEPRPICSHRNQNGEKTSREKRSCVHTGRDLVVELLRH
jgi:hypothetical protein